MYFHFEPTRTRETVFSGGRGGITGDGPPLTHVPSGSSCGDPTAETVESPLTGVFLAFARRLDGAVGHGTVAAALSADEALREARRRMRIIGRFPGRNPARGTAVPADAPDRHHRTLADGGITAWGALSGNRYTLEPRAVLGPAGRSRLPEEELLGAIDATEIDAVSPRQVETAVAEVMAIDVAMRWWRRPTPVLVPVHEEAEAALPEAARAEARAAGLSVSGYALRGFEFAMALVVLHHADRTSGTWGTAVGPGLDAALRGAVLRCVEKRAIPVSGSSFPLRARRLAGWHCTREYLEFLDHHCGDAPPRAFAPLEEARYWTSLAELRFGGEPLLVSPWDCPGLGSVRVVCPGAASSWDAVTGPDYVCPFP
ncbi:hypothetical protein SAMN02745673_01376 [Marinactinospora thermotolerans DSM 45154]|uniref:YcaO domain-containing protein n=1 Tax=Marinactinospora thermotolerans DSM 45154 TaxID=1122192 RepID=A0A1T4NBQ8_9ACTN|nr:hypothetical protein [Marinactinospora thermotolerans]SJZ76709.1 hypothetical protein SAMN02745673_01376 [Marinactinospora thermotolerans DSM 45154]